METKTLLSKVKWILLHNEKARNIDNYCVLKLWKEFYQIEEWAFPIQNIFQLQELLETVPSVDDIIRCRREIQSKNSKHYDSELLPTSPDVTQKRSKREVLIHINRENL